MSIKLSRKRLKSYEKKTLSDLPCDLESEILSRVPANSLTKLKTTCKRWYSLFKEPKFVEKNLEKARAKKVKILLTSFRVYSVNVDLHDLSIEFTGKLKCLKDSKDLKISQIVHCNGLILCSTKDATKLLVWNPCTGETISVKPRNIYRKSDKYALGYGESKSAYKILRSCSYHKDKKLEHLVVEFEIYDFNSGCWKVLDDFTRKWNIYFDGISLKGNTYWIASDKEGGYVHTFLCFDFTTESFVSFPLPYQSDDEDDENSDSVALSVFRGEKIALLYQSFDDDVSMETRIWLTNKIDEGCEEVSWSKFFVVDLEKFKLSCIDSVVTFMLEEDDEEENKMAVCCSRGMMEDDSYVYIVGEDLYKEVHREYTNGSWCGGPCLLGYVPSLVRIQQGTPHGQSITEEFT